MKHTRQNNSGRTLGLNGLQGSYQQPSKVQPHPGEGVTSQGLSGLHQRSTTSTKQQRRSQGDKHPDLTFCLGQTLLVTRGNTAIKVSFPEHKAGEKVRWGLQRDK